MSLSPVQRLRRFNRAVTTETGLLDQSFLGRGRPLAAARVINAIGPSGCAVSTIRKRLDLDPAFLSRLLAQLEEEKLIGLIDDPHDKRKKTALLTEHGRAEYEAYEKLSNQRAERILARHSSPEALLAALDLVASAFARDHIEITEIDPTHPYAVSCVTQYFTELAARFPQGFDPAKAAAAGPQDMTPPRGAFFVALSDGLPLGCVGLKHTTSAYSEVKRLWVAPAARGLGLAKDLMRAVEDHARAADIRLLRLDTNSALPEAARLYDRLGWTRIARFNDDPYPDIFFEKRL